MKTKLILIIGIAIISYLTVVGYQNYTVIPCKLNTIYLDSINSFDGQTQTVRFDTKGNVRGIEILVDGITTGRGKLTIGYNESDSYRDYDLDSGNVDFQLKGDWKSTHCYVTFRPDKMTNGQFEISCNFIGDEE